MALGHPVRVAPYSGLFDTPIPRHKNSHNKSSLDFISTLFNVLYFDQTVWHSRNHLVELNLDEQIATLLDPIKIPATEINQSIRWVTAQLLY